VSYRLVGPGARTSPEPPPIASHSEGEEIFWHYSLSDFRELNRLIDTRAPSRASCTVTFGLAPAVFTQPMTDQQPHQAHLVDLLQTGSALTVQWLAAPGAHARPVAAETLALIGKHVTALAEAERRAGLSRDAVPPSGSVPTDQGLEAAQRALGETLYRLLDGPDRALARRLDDARNAGTLLHLVIRLRTSDRKALARHPGLAWHFQLLASLSEGPLALMAAPPVTIAVQLGDAEFAQPDKVAGGRLQLLFMAYSPREVQPVLDYEAEEERILVELAPFVEAHRLVVRVAEEGSLAELRRRLMDRAYDIVHLTGHGVATANGARLVMEDADGDRDDVSAERLLKALRDGRRMPRMLVISSCHSAEQCYDLPSLAAELIEGGVPCVVGWTLPVLDTVATDAAEELYRRLCSGEGPAEAVAKARRQLHREDQRRPTQAHAWATLEVLATKASGFAIDPEEKPAQEPAPPGVVYRMLGNRMRVLTHGFVGRRRELQALGRILRRGRWAPPGGEEQSVAGALVAGMKGQGKSCLVGRAIDRHQHDTGELSTVVLHGALDELTLLEAFRVEAERLGDDAAETTLDDAAREVPQRIARLLRRHWRERRVVIVLDDFEQNLEIPGEGEAQLSPFAAALLEALLPICHDEQPKLLVTSTARFALPPSLEGLLAEVPLGALEAASVHKLWSRGRTAELAGLGPNAWRELCERFGRNARLLDWARQLLGGKTPDEVRRVMAEAGKALPVWRDQLVDEARQEDLVAAFLRHMAFDEAARKVGPDAMAFVDRARVYEVPVPAEAFAGLVDGLEISLDRHVPALMNLGLLELGAEEGRAVYRVSPLVKAQFDAPDWERWHGVAAEYWWKAAERSDGTHIAWVLQSWEHALAAKRQDLADRAANILEAWFRRRGLYAWSAALGIRHLEFFSESAPGLRWAGSALVASGKLQAGREFLERALEIDEKVHGTQEHPAVSASLHELAVVLHTLGDLAASRALLERSLEIDEKVYGTQDHPNVAASLHALGGVLGAQGDLAGARALLERSRKIYEKGHGTQEHPEVATSLHELARVLCAQGDLAGARVLLERSLEIDEKVHFTHEHPEVATSLHELASVLRAQGDLDGARMRLDRSREILEKVHGSQEHPAVATSLYSLAAVLHAQGDLDGARARLERSLEIDEKVHGTRDHPEIATTYDGLGHCLRAQGLLDESERAFRTAVEIYEKVFGTRDHYQYAETEFALAMLLRQRDRHDEAKDLLRHALTVLRSQVPTHPILAARRAQAQDSAAAG
jgi:tetratricopeptide (TPR) repeat protein